MLANLFGSSATPIYNFIKAFNPPHSSDLFALSKEGPVGVLQDLAPLQRPYCPGGEFCDIPLPELMNLQNIHFSALSSVKKFDFFQNLGTTNEPLPDIKN